MHDRLDHHRVNEDALLAAALSALPAAPPGTDTWPALAARIRRRQAVRRTIGFVLPAALAAGIALVFAWPHLRLQAPAPVRIASPTASATASTEIAALQASSRRWQAWVQTLDRNGAPLDGRRLARAVSLQDQIGMVDLQISASRDAATLGGLWQQRIELLQQLGLLHLQPYMVADRARAGRDPAIPM